ncbi:LysR family transcriptional regulator substrate-binding protein [Streptomyces sp. CA-250714]|uniref:LysR family transcriptional regulator substrate-binding protein n=1 Tax=Streptomyces sp. CA-250714 TaxID=3240060 RepID=UPI003D8F2180
MRSNGPATWRSRAGSSKDVVIGASELVPTSWPAKAMGHLRASAPRLSVRVVNFADTQALLDAVGSGGVDIAVGPVRPPAWTGRKHQVGTLEFGIAVPRRSSSAARVPAGNLAGRDWIACPSNASVLTQLRASIGDVDMDQPAAPNLAAAVSYVDAGLGATLVPVGYVLPSSLRLVGIQPAPTADLYALALDATEAATFDRITQEITVCSHS